MPDTTIRPTRPCRIMMEQAIRDRINRIRKQRPRASYDYICQHIDDEGAPRFYIDENTAFKYIRQLNCGLYNGNRNFRTKNARRRAQDFYKVYYQLHLKHLRDMQDRDVITLAIHSHAPSFYVSADKVRLLAMGY